MDHGQIKQTKNETMTIENNQLKGVATMFKSNDTGLELLIIAGDEKELALILREWFEISDFDPGRFKRVAVTMDHSTKPKP